MKIPDDSAWLCMEKLKKHSFETQKPKIQPKITPTFDQTYFKNPKNIRKEIALLGPFKGPCTLP